MGLQYSPHSSAPPSLAAGPQLRGITHNLTAQLVHTKDSLVCLLANLRPSSTWQLGMCRHVLCMCLHVLLCVLAKARPCMLGTQMVSPWRLARGSLHLWWGTHGEAESRPRGKAREIPVARAHMSLRAPHGALTAPGASKSPKAYSTGRKTGLGSFSRLLNPWAQRGRVSGMGGPRHLVGTCGTPSPGQPARWGRREPTPTGQPKETVC